MDKETATYIRSYFSNLMTDQEKLALQYCTYMSQTSESPKMRRMLEEKGWIKHDTKIIKFIGNSYDEFEPKIVDRIMMEAPEKIFSQ